LVAIAEAKQTQMVLFDAYPFEVPSSQRVAPAPEWKPAWAPALGAALIILAWAPIALLIWALTSR
jgi:hypothetical protein